jgi:hypothetical protein
MPSKYRQIIQHIYENFSNSIICKDHFQKGRRGRARMVVRCVVVPILVYK